MLQSLVDSAPQLAKMQILNRIQNRLEKYHYLCI